MQRIRGLASLIGNTPLLAIDFEFRGRHRRLYAKAEHLNMTGSIKDRMAFEQHRTQAGPKAVTELGDGDLEPFLIGPAPLLAGWERAALRRTSRSPAGSGCGRVAADRAGGIAPHRNLPEPHPHRVEEMTQSVITLPTARSS
jgi:hypothetical protein